jgi:hypothetical protein
MCLGLKVGAACKFSAWGAFQGALCVWVHNVCVPKDYDGVFPQARSLKIALVPERSWGMLLYAVVNRVCVCAASDHGASY